MVVYQFRTVATAHRCALGGQLRGVDWPSAVRVQVEVPGLRVPLLYLEESHGKLPINSRVVVIEVLTHLGPVSNRSSINSLNTLVTAVGLQPVVSDCSKAFRAFAAKVFSREGDIAPSISSKSDSAGNASFVEGSVRKHAHFVLLGSLMLVPFRFQTPVIEVCEIPDDSRVVIEHFNFDGVSGIASPVGRGLCKSQNHQDGEENQVCLHSTIINPIHHIWINMEESCSLKSGSFWLAGCVGSYLSWQKQIIFNFMLSSPTLCGPSILHELE